MGGMLDLGLRGERVIQGNIRMRREKKQEKGKKYQLTSYKLLH